MLTRMLEKRGFLPKDSGMLMRYDINSIPYLTAYAGEDDRCDMSSHSVFGRVRNTSCMRGRGGNKAGRSTNSESTEEPSSTTTRNSSSDSCVMEEMCKFFSKSCFQFYSKPFCDCAMITEGEFSNAVEEFSRMTTKFVQFFGDMPFFGKHKTLMENLGIPNIPRCFVDFTQKQVFEQGQPIIRAKTFMSGEIGIGIDWMCMLLLLSISGSSRIDQQLGKNVAMNLVAELFNKIPFTMFPYDAIQVREFNPHMPSQEIVQLRPSASRFTCVVRPNNKCVLNDTVPMQERILVPSCPLSPQLMMEDIGIASPLYDLCNVLGIRHVYNLPVEMIPWQVPYPIGVPWPVIRYGKIEEQDSNDDGDNEKERDKGFVIVAPGGKTKLCIYGRTNAITLGNVGDVSSIHKMGPRPLFCTPCRGWFLCFVSLFLFFQNHDIFAKKQE